MSAHEPRRRPPHALPVRPDQTVHHTGHHELPRPFHGPRGGVGGHRRHDNPVSDHLPGHHRHCRGQHRRRGFKPPPADQDGCAGPLPLQYLVAGIVCSVITPHQLNPGQIKLGELDRSLLEQYLLLLHPVHVLLRAGDRGPQFCGAGCLEE